MMITNWPVAWAMVGFFSICTAIFILTEWLQSYTTTIKIQGKK